MPEVTAIWTFVGIWLTAALWVVLDAEARARNPIVWGGLTIFFGPFALGAYAITGERGRTASPSERRRSYFFTATFFFLGVSYACLITLVAVALDAGASRDPISSEDARVVTAIMMAMLVFSVPLWGFHWMQTLGLLEKLVSDKEDRALYLTARRYGAVVLVLGGLVSLGFGIFLVFSAFAAALGVYEGSRDQFLPVAAFLPLTLLLMAYHYLAIFKSPHYELLAGRFDVLEPEGETAADAANTDPGT